jgi:deoxyribonuclease V
MGLIACTDAHYTAITGAAACVLLADWEDAEPPEERTAVTPLPAPYESGRLYLRELPCLAKVLLPIADRISVVFVDGYVWLDGAQRAPGLGAHLHRFLGGHVTVIGAAKTWHPGANSAVPVLRGAGSRPLYVSSAGMPAEAAASCIRRMHGPHRIPTMLKHTDRLARAVR